MTIRGIHDLIKKSKIPYSQFNDLPSFVAAHGTVESPVYFDLYGSLFQFIKKKLYEGQRAKLIFTLIQILKIENLIVVTDGKRSNQKMVTAFKRLDSNERSLSILNVQLKKAERLKRLSKSHWKRLHASRLAAYSISEVDIEFILNSLVQAGVRVERAEFEADVWIAQKVQSVVVSRDGDFHCHKNVKVLCY